MENRDNTYLVDVEECLQEHYDEAVDILQDEEKSLSLLEKVVVVCDGLSTLPGIGEYIADIPSVCYMIRDYVQGRYKQVPVATMISLTFSFLYLVLPFDFIPDYIPGIGYIDDMGIIRYVFNSVHNDIFRYVKWRMIQFEREEIISYE